jgi:hypothetical protein
MRAERREEFCGGCASKANALAPDTGERGVCDESPALVLSKKEGRNEAKCARSLRQRFSRGDVDFRACPLISLPGHGRLLIRVRDCLAFLEQYTYDGRTRVR